MANIYRGGMQISGNSGGGSSIDTTQLTQNILNGVEEIIRPSGHQYPNISLYPTWIAPAVRNGNNNISLSNSDNLYALEHMDVTNFQSLYQMLNQNIYAPATLDIDLTRWNVSNVSSMFNMFTNSSFSPRSINMNGWDIRNVVSMYQVFYYCSARYLYIENWNFNNITNMQEAFSVCGYLKELDFSTSDLSFVTNFYRTFYSDTNLEKLIWGGALNAVDSSSTSPALDLSLCSAMTPANAELFFQSLGTKTSNGTTTIKMPTSAQGADVSIATAKGYVISGITQP